MKTKLTMLVIVQIFYLSFLGFAQDKKKTENKASPETIKKNKQDNDLKKQPQKEPVKKDSVNKESKEDIEKKKKKHLEYLINTSFKNLDHPSILERYTASNYLYKYYTGGSRDSEILSFLRYRLISSEDLPACYNLIRLLGKIKSNTKETRELLIRTVGMTGLQVEVRKAAADSLGKIGNKDTVKELERYIVWERLKNDKEVFFTLIDVAGELRGQKYTLKEVLELENKYKQSSIKPAQENELKNKQ